MKNESFVCNKVPQYPQKVLGAAGGLIQGNVPLICSGFNGYLPKDDYKKCYALKNKKWKHVKNLHEARAYQVYILTTVTVANNIARKSFEFAFT